MDINIGSSVITRHIRTRHFGRMLAISCLSGLLLGVGARLTMRFVALEAGMPTGFSLGGSFEVIAFGAMVGSPVALLLFALRLQVEFGQPWGGLVTGLVLLGILAAIPPPAAQSALTATPDTPVSTALAFGALFATWGLALEYLDQRLLRRPPSQSERAA